VFSWSLFNPGYTIASLIATKFNEAADVNERAVLIEAGFVLLLMELVIQIVAQAWLKRMRAKTGARA
jgi:ABC-type phosphate transport system permease subunit